MSALAYFLAGVLFASVPWVALLSWLLVQTNKALMNTNESADYSNAVLVRLLRAVGIDEPWFDEVIERTEK